MTRRPALLLPLLVAVAALARRLRREAGAPRAERLEQVELMLDYFPNADHAGIYAAQAGGDFEQAGLDVEDPPAARPGGADQAGGGGPGRPRDLLRARGAARARPGPATWSRSAAIVRKPLTSIISLPKARIRGPEDLAGKTVGTAGIDYQSAYLQTILDDAGVDARLGQAAQRRLQPRRPRCSPARSTRPRRASGTTRARSCAAQGKRPRIIRIEDAGVPTYDELVLVANADALEQDRDRIRAFIGALSRGTQDAGRGSGERDRGPAEGQPRPRSGAAARRRQDHAAAAPARRGKPFGWQGPAEWDAFPPGCARTGCSTSRPTPRSAFTNELLPGSGL